MQGKLIAVAYTLRTYLNQFSLGRICKQEQMHQSLVSEEVKALNLIKFKTFLSSINKDDNMLMFLLCFH